MNWCCSRRRFLRLKPHQSMFVHRDFRKVKPQVNEPWKGGAQSVGRIGFQIPLEVCFWRFLFFFSQRATAVVCQPLVKTPGKNSRLTSRRHFKKILSTFPGRCNPWLSKTGIRASGEGQITKAPGVGLRGSVGTYLLYTRYCRSLTHRFPPPQAPEGFLMEVLPTETILANSFQVLHQ